LVKQLKDTIAVLEQMSNQGWGRGSLRTVLDLEDSSARGPKSWPWPWPRQALALALASTMILK